MSDTPKVFISATSGDLRGIRQIVKETLLTIGCHPVEQTNFPPDWRTVEGMLRARIEDCDALIHIAGLRYGAEPDPDTLPPGTPRRSYTQMEYHLGTALHAARGDTGFRVYTFICPESFPCDIPTDADGQPSPPEPEEKTRLQREHRAALLGSTRIYDEPKDADDLRLRLGALKEEVLALQREQAGVKEEVRGLHRPLLIGLALLLLLLGGGFGAYRMLHRDLAGLSQIDTARIKTHLRESSERKLAEDLAAAGQAAKSDDRERLRAAADAAHQSRLGRIDELAQSFAVLEGKADASPILKEMTRILSDEGVDAALAYAERQKPALLKAAADTLAAHREKVRGQLQPLLQAAGLQWVKGQTAAARDSYRDLLALDPQWPEALEHYAWFLYDQSSQTLAHGSLANALADATACLDHAQRYHDLAPAEPRGRRALSAAHNKLADVLTIRGASGDAETALKHYTRSLEVAEKLLQANPDSAEAPRDVSVSLNKLGDFLATRGQPGDAETALKHYTRCQDVLEKLLQANPDSAKAARDVSVSLERLGDFLAARGQPGDAETALKHYTRSLEVREKLLQANPDSALAARDVSASQVRLGNFLAGRGQPGDAETALKHYTRSLGVREKLLQDNPDSAEAARDVSVSHYKLAAYCEQRGDRAGEERHSRACYDLLHTRIARGMTFDPPALRVHEQLHARFGGK